MQTLPFYFDFISPYAYLGWTRVHRVAASHGLVVEPVPVVFAALLNHHGNVGPAEIPAKRMYVFKDALRRAARLGVPLAPPAAHPFHPVLALRVAAVGPDEIADSEPRRVIDALFAGAWGGERAAMDAPDSLVSLLDRAGLPGQALVEAAARPEVKERLHGHTARAIAAGVFGVPTTQVGEELFWGLDALPLVADALEGRDPVLATDLGVFRDLPATASR